MRRKATSRRSRPKTRTKTHTHRHTHRRKSSKRTAHQRRFAALARKFGGRIPKGTKI